MKRLTQIITGSALLLSVGCGEPESEGVVCPDDDVVFEYESDEEVSNTLDRILELSTFDGYLTHVYGTMRISVSEHPALACLEHVDRIGIGLDGSQRLTSLRSAPDIQFFGEFLTLPALEEPVDSLEILTRPNENPEVRMPYPGTEIRKLAWTLETTDSRLLLENAVVTQSLFVDGAWQNESGPGIDVGGLGVAEHLEFVDLFGWFRNLDALAVRSIGELYLRIDTTDGRGFVHLESVGTLDPGGFPASSFPSLERVGHLNSGSGLLDFPGLVRVTESFRGVEGSGFGWGNLRSDEDLE